MALLASAVVTALYHLGFAEYRGAQVLQPVLGNSIITLAYLLSGNPLAPILAHVMMHGAAVLHGPETTLQLPPHY
jgi:membrane protease YdiL (CAAX protease family)